MAAAGGENSHVNQMGPLLGLPGGLFGPLEGTVRISTSQLAWDLTNPRDAFAGAADAANIVRRSVFQCRLGRGSEEPATLAAVAGAFGSDQVPCSQGAA